MRIVVFGATGGTGRAAVRRAAERGDLVSAFARTPSKLGFEHPRVSVLEGDARDAGAVSEAIRGQDAVLSLLGTRPWRHTDVCSRGARHIVAAMREHAVRRLVVLSSLGVGDTREHVGWFGRRVMIPLLLRRELEDKERMEEVVRASDLDWVIVRLAASVLTNGPPTGRWRTGARLQGGSMARADLAEFCLSQLESDEFLRQAPLVAA